MVHKGTGNVRGQLEAWDDEVELSQKLIVASGGILKLYEIVEQFKIDRGAALRVLHSLASTSVNCHSIRNAIELELDVMANSLSLLNALAAVVEKEAEWGLAKFMWTANSPSTREFYDPKVFEEIKRRIAEEDTPGKGLTEAKKFEAYQMRELSSRYMMDEDYINFVNILILAAEQGCADSQYLLSMVYFEGCEEIQKDERKSLELLILAAKNGSSEAVKRMRTLGDNLLGT